MSELYMGEVTLEQVLLSREERSARQKQLLRRFGAPLVSFTMNIPGPVKDTPLIRFAFRAALRRLETQLGEPLYRQCLYQPTGCEALLAFRQTAPALKEVCLSIEEGAPVGRLYDLDVLDTDGRKLSRPQPRRCLLCGGPAAICARSRAHALEALQLRTEELLRGFAADRLSCLAEEALLSEVSFTPKPGLVDRRTTGAHRDMDLSLFVCSAKALAPHFRRFAAMGMEGASPKALQQAGRLAEEAMFAATGGVNTHKGAIYSLSLLLSAVGEILTRGGRVLPTAGRTAAALPPAKGTHGSAVHARYGVGGAREEAAAGFPSLRRCYETLQREGPLAALLQTMAHLEDTNLYHRGGAEGAAYVRRAAAEILNAPYAKWEPLAAELDGELTRRNLSPGGSADLLALALFLQSISPLLEPDALW